MCGLFGIFYGPGGSAAEPWNPSELMEIMYPAIIHRGRDSWGYMLHRNDDRYVEWCKRSGSAVLKDSAADMQIEHPENVQWLACHVRKGTGGSPDNLANDHPIKHQNIIGMHNGALTGWRDIIKETGRDDPTAEVDSEAIFAAVNKWGAKEGLKRVTGSMVTMFVDLRKPDQLTFARTRERPLVYGITEAGSLMWASEASVIQATGIKIKGQLHSWTQVNTMMTLARPKFTNRIEFRKPEPIAPRSYNMGGWQGSGYGGGYGLGAKPDKFGGKYIGAGMWQIDVDGHSKMLDAEQYVEWAVEGEIARRAKVIRDSRQRAKKDAKIRAIESEQKEAS